MGKIKSNEQRLAEYNKIHGGKYVYHKVVYTGPRDKIEIICPTHGSFWQSAATHMRGSGCPQCAKNLVREKQLQKNKLKNKDGSKVLDLEDFIRKSKDIWGDKFDYSKTIYRGHNKKLSIMCPHHGEFETVARSHLTGKDCKKCSIEKANKAITDSKRLAGFVVDTHSFIEESKGVHKDFYRYNKTKYTSSKEAVIITCPTHGDFYQTPEKHLVGKGCRKCRIHHSLIENKVAEFMASTGLSVERNKFFSSDGKKYELDLFIKELGIGVEINGCYYHSTANRNFTRGYHRDKRKFFNSLGIRVIFIWEDEIKYNWESLKSYLLSAVTKENRRIFARKCEAIEINNAEAMAVLDSNHLLKRSSNCKINLALKYSGEIVALMSFNNSYGKWTLVRMVNILGTTVVGGFSKLLHEWRRRFPEEDLISFIDLDKFTGKTYFKCGFIPESEELTMWYVRRDTRYSKFGFRRKKIITKLKNYDQSLSESQNCRNHRIYQTWNSGTLRVKLPSVL